MRNSNVTGDEDKISFVRSNLEGASLAAQMMQASAFDPKYIAYNYTVFRQNFLEVFGLVQRHDSLQWIFHFADSLTDKLGSLDYLRAQASAANIAREAMESLTKASWLENGTLSESKLHSLIELICYIQYLSPAERRLASTIKFTPGDSLLNFGSRLGKKLKDSPKPSPTSSDISQPTPVAPVQHALNTAPVICSYCSKKGHKATQCYRRKRDAAKAPLPSTNSQNTHTSQHLNTSTPPNRSKTAPTRKWCHVHELCGHSTDECLAIQKLRGQPASPSQSGNQSGEAKRLSQNHPS